MNTNSFNQSSQDVLQAFGTDPERGLTADDAVKHFLEYGPNELEQVEKHRYFGSLSSNSRSQYLQSLASRKPVFVVPGSSTACAIRLDLQEFSSTSKTPVV